MRTYFVSSALALIVAFLCVTGAALAGGMQSLIGIEDAAEGVAEGDTAGAAATAAAHKIIARWSEVRVSMGRNGATRAELTAADAAVRSLEDAMLHSQDLRRAANGVTAALAPLFGRAGDKVPIDVHRLDYFRRAIELDVEAGDWPRAQSDTSAMAARWSAIRPLVAARRNSSSAAVAFDRAQRAIEDALQARSARKMLAATNRSGDAVDGLEKLF